MMHQCNKDEVQLAEERIVEVAVAMAELREDFHEDRNGLAMQALFAAFLDVSDRALEARRDRARRFMETVRLQTRRRRG